MVPAIDEVFTDTFQGVEVGWILRNRQIDSNSGPIRLTYYDLTFPKKAEDIVRCSYLPFVSQVAASTRERMKTPRKLFSLDVTGTWRSVTLKCLSYIHTLAQDPQVRRNITDDLPRAMVPTTSCNKPCKAYKRGYLLYGPTGTGKTSLIAVMAEYLKFDVYNLDLSHFSSNSQLQASLMATANFLIVVEDIHCLTEFDNTGAEQVTLSGLLDFMDGGWPNCGDQRIIVYKEKLDPALLTPGRVDFHIHMPYYTPSAFEILASNSLNIITHKLFKEIKKSILEVQVSPAEVADQLKPPNSVDKTLEGLVEFLN